LKRQIALLLCLSVLPARAEVLTLQGLGQVHFGMTFSGVERVLGHKIPIDEAVSGDASGCAQAGWPGKDGVTFMFEKYRLTRMDVWKPSNPITTAEGAHVGSSEGELRRFYGGRAIFSSHPYLDEEGHYVTVRYPAQNRKLIFETEHGRVTSFRIGYPKPAEYIEGCL
jgi:hypothetical protein